MIRTESTAEPDRAVDNVRAENAAAIQGPKSSHIAWHGWSIDRDKREKRSGHKAAAIWLTGYSGSGKSTVADALEKQLFERNIRTMLLDGDNVRHGLCSDLGFSDKDRTENLRRVGEVAKLFFENGMVVICSFISPLASQRRFARGLIAPGRFFEIYVRCNLDVCKRRDPRGLYRKAAAGEIPYFTGVSLPYEEPQNPDMVVDTDLKSVDLIADEILCLLTSHGIIPNISANPPATGTEHSFPGI